MRITLKEVNQLKEAIANKFPELKINVHQKHVTIQNLYSTSYSLVDIKEFAADNDIYGAHCFTLSSQQVEIEKMFLDWFNNSGIYEGHISNWFSIVKSFPEAEKMWEMLCNNECYCNLSDKPEETKEVNTVISQQEIKNEITSIKVEIEKLIELIDYLDNNDINGNIYDVTQEELDNLYQQLNELEAQLDPTIEIKAQIEANQRELKKLSVILTQAISELSTLKVSQIQQEITNTVKEIEILQDRLNGNSNVARLFG